MAGWGGEENRHRCQQAGFDHHLLQPVDMDALGEVLAQCRGGD
jgi:CheY-like chemotaxis protein